MEFPGNTEEDEKAKQEAILNNPGDNQTVNVDDVQSENNAKQQSSRNEEDLVVMREDNTFETRSHQ